MKILYFTVAETGNKKYTAHILKKNGEIKDVSFGDKRYAQYKDSVPKSLGGSAWSHKDHLNKTRRKNYRKRHKAILAETKSGKIVPAYTRNNIVPPGFRIISCGDFLNSKYITVLYITLICARVSFT